jgi:hypothetical protein
MDEVLMEAQRSDGEWMRIGSVSEAEPPGSISHDGPGGRRVLIFGWYKDVAGVWESLYGFDVENELAREVHTTGLELLSDLEKPYELEVIRKGLRMPVRFTLRTA